MTDDAFLACERRASRAHPPIVLRTATNQMAYALATKPPPWQNPTLKEEPVEAVLEPRPKAFVPHGARPHPDAIWPRLYGFLRWLATQKRPLPYLSELPVVLDCCRSRSDGAMKQLIEYGYVERTIKPRSNAPSEVRIVIVESGAAVMTAGWT